MQLRRRLRALVSALSAAVVIVSLFVAVGPTRAAAAGGHATDWMNQRKWGVSVHYLAEGCPPGCQVGSYVTGKWPTVAEWNDRVDNYDVEGVVNQVKSVGAGWFQIPVGQISGYWAAPNPVYEKYVPATDAHPSRISQRDLIKDLATAAHAKGLKFMAYIPLDPPRNDAYAAGKLGADPNNHDDGGVHNADFQKKWLEVAKYWAQEWGPLIDGWWVDGGFANLDSYASDFIDALHTGNPDSLIGLSAAGWQYETNKNAAAKSDVVSGEDKLSLDGRWRDYNGTQVLNHGLNRIQGHWGNPPNAAMSMSTEALVNHAVGAASQGGAMTWDVGYDWASGRISDSSMAQLAAVGEATGTLPGNGGRTDSGSSSINYNGAWGTASGSQYFGGSARTSTATGNSASFTFDGTSVKWVGAREAGAGTAEVRIDGGPPTTVDLASSPPTGNDVVFARYGLSRGKHTITITPTTAGVVSVDAFEVDTTTMPDVDDSDSAITYNGFSSSNPGSCFNNTCHNSNTEGSTATYKFTGTGITWNSVTGPDQGTATVSIDGGPATSVNLADEARSVDVPAYLSPALPYGTHTIKITTESSRWVTIDRFVIDPHPNAITGVASERCADAPQASAEDGNDLQLHTCNKTAAQKFTFDSATGEVRALGKCMDVQQADTSDGTPVQLYQCNGTKAQKWTYDPVGKQLKAFDKCLDVDSGGTGDGTRLIIHACHGGSSQQWRLGA